MASERAWPTEADYAWSEHWEGLGFRVALVQGHGPAYALRLLIQDPATEIMDVQAVRTWAAERPYPDYATSVEAAAVDGWTVIVELNGFQATIPSVLKRVSRDMRMVATYRGANAHMSVDWAVNGEHVRRFDPLLYGDHIRIGDPLPQEQGLLFGVSHAQSWHSPAPSDLPGCARLSDFSMTVTHGWPLATIRFSAAKLNATDQLFSRMPTSLTKSDTVKLDDRIARRRPARSVR